MRLPNFIERRRRERPVEFVDASKVFKPQIQVKMLKDVSGWSSRDRRLKWNLQTGRSYYIDADKAREFIIKGYAEGDLPWAASQDEIAEIRAEVTVIRPGVNTNG